MIIVYNMIIIYIISTISMVVVLIVTMFHSAIYSYFNLVNFDEI